MAKTLGVPIVFCHIPRVLFFYARTPRCKPKVGQIRAAATSAEALVFLQMTSLHKLYAILGHPEHWLIDNDALEELTSKIAFIQNTCNICNAANGDVMHSLSKTGLTA